MKILLFIILLVHGIIHLMGFVKSVNPDKITELKQEVSKIAGLFWLIVSLLFVVSSFLLLFDFELWWLAALPAVVCSQILIVLFWKDAKFGTILNILIILIALFTNGIFY